MQMMINSDRDIRTNIAENILEANGDIVALSDAIFNNPIKSTFYDMYYCNDRNQKPTNNELCHINTSNRVFQVPR